MKRVRGRLAILFVAVAGCEGSGTEQSEEDFDLRAQSSCAAYSEGYRSAFEVVGSLLSRVETTAYVANFLGDLSVQVFPAFSASDEQVATMDKQLEAFAATAALEGRNLERGFWNLKGISAVKFPGGEDYVDVLVLSPNTSPNIAYLAQFSEGNSEIRLIQRLDQNTADVSTIHCIE